MPMFGSRRSRHWDCSTLSSMLSTLSQLPCLAQVSHGRPETRIKPRGCFQRHYNLFTLRFRFPGWKGGSAVDAENLVDAFASSSGWLGWRMLMMRPSVSSRRVVTRLLVLSTLAVCQSACVAVGLQPFADPAQKVVGEHADELGSFETDCRDAAR